MSIRGLFESRFYTSLVQKGAYSKGPLTCKCPLLKGVRTSISIALGYKLDMPPPPPYAANQSDVELPLMAWKECDLPGGHQANTPGLVICIRGNVPQPRTGPRGLTGSVHCPYLYLLLDP